MDAAQIENDLTSIVLTNDQIQDRILEIAAQIDIDYAHSERPLLMVGVLKGAVMVMADLARAVSISVELDFMAVSSYGSGTKSSGVVRIIKDLDIDLAGRDVLIMMRKPDAIKIEVPAKYIGFDIPNEFVVGFGLDYAEKYRNLREVGVLAPHVYGG